MLSGRIININSTKYLVEVDSRVYDCTLRGIFRKEKITPFVGDNVEIDEKTNQIIKVLPRKNSLLRPNIANIDIALIITSTKKPDLDLYLLDKLLVMVYLSNITPVICFTKCDLLNKEELKGIYELQKYYESIGIETLINTDLKKFKKLASGKVIVACGQTGAGKSTFINKLSDDLNLKTNEISEKLGRGVHTTRYVSLYKICDFFLADSPGFSFLDISNYKDEEINKGFIEFKNYPCKYNDCNHINTEGCNIMNNKNILLSRYENYVKLIKEKK